MPASSPVLCLLLAGGSGRRLFPLSTPEKPKQFLPLTHPTHSMLQLALDRARRLSDEPPWITTQENYLPLIAEQTSHDEPPPFILSEPAGRNTAATILCGALLAEQLHGPDAMMAVLPCDHVIDDQTAWLETVREGLWHARKTPCIFLLGVLPVFPATQFGYIVGSGSASPYTVACFREKPDEGEALRLMRRPGCFWNSGVFIFRIGTLLSIVHDVSPFFLEQCRGAIPPRPDRSNPLRFTSNYFQLEALQFDREILQKTNRLRVIPLSCGWHDVGTMEGYRLLLQGRENVVNPDHSPAWEGEEKKHEK